MKPTTTRIASLFSIIALTAVIVFSLPACKRTSETDKKTSGTVTANADGTILFQYSRTATSFPASCSFTTNLPAPNDQFVLTIAAGGLTAEQTIQNLTPGQVVKWTATVAAGNPLNHGSGNFVHIIND